MLLYEESFTLAVTLCMNPGPAHASYSALHQTYNPPSTLPPLRTHLPNPLPRRHKQPITPDAPLIRQLERRLDPRGGDPVLEDLALAAGHGVREGQVLWQQAELAQRRRLIPRNVLVAQPVAAHVDHGHEGDAHGEACWGDTWEAVLCPGGGGKRGDLLAILMTGRGLDDNVWGWECLQPVDLHVVRERVDELVHNAIHPDSAADQLKRRVIRVI